jgi:hypothetical protein
MLIGLCMTACALFWAAPAARAAGEDTYGLLDITLGSSYARLERDLDFRYITASLAQMTGNKPDLGKRGYGCMRRDDPQADVGCVSHDEKLGGIVTREIRLHFLNGRLYQFSMSAEVQHYEAMLAELRSRNGAPQNAAGAEEAVRWQNESGRIAAYRGKDLVFVNFELLSYADAVQRKRDGATLECN